MNIINNCGSDAGEISDKIINMVKSKNDLEMNFYSYVFLTTHIKNPETGELVLHKMYGRLDVPTTLYDEDDEGDNMIYIDMYENKFYLEKNGVCEEVKGNIFLPKSATIIDSEKYIKDKLKETGCVIEEKDADTTLQLILNAQPEKVQLPHGENIVNMYLGRAAEKEILKTLSPN